MKEINFFEALEASGFDHVHGGVDSAVFVGKAPVMEKKPNRFWDAWMIQQGACNASGVALALHKACIEAREDGVQLSEDPACRMIGYQLAYLLRLAEYDQSPLAYDRDYRICEEKKGS